MLGADVFLKVCGITRLTDALHAVQHGASAIGFVFWPKSPRSVHPARAADIIAELPSNVTTVGVFVNEPVEGIRQTVAATGLTMVQLHGDEPPAYADALPVPLLRAVTLSQVPGVFGDWPAATTWLLDAADPVRRGGTGTTVDWQRAAAAARDRQVVLAGGLTPENVATAIGIVRPFGVDVSSGVEAAPGVKDFAKVARFLESARMAFDASEVRRGRL
jgi:phosphoribosylanthranilate isomerase